MIVHWVTRGRCSFSHPGEFTPGCTTELGYMELGYMELGYTAKIKPDRSIRSQACRLGSSIPKLT